VLAGEEVAEGAVEDLAGLGGLEELAGDREIEG
jgi:hypothetical protein